MSQVDFKRAFNKMKHDLESWRGLIISIDSVLKWEKNYYPALVFAVVTVFFLVLWMMDMSTLTMLAIVGLICIAFDFAYPTISRFFFNTDNWNGTQETQFEEVCDQLCTMKMTLWAWYEFMFAAKERKSTMFVIFMSLSLLAMAWIGAIIDNLLLLYVICLSLAMYPGIKKQGVLDGLKSKFGSILNSKMQQLREKTNKAE